ncbi:MAG: acyl-CoA thioesterase [Ruminococcus sp.]|nr:acyl-CoA thioesterase [Ruminococcus sp.]
MIYTHVVQYYETDKMQIVHHSNYVRWMEEARVFFLDKIGASFVTLEEMGILSPVLEVSCRYLSSIRFGESVDIDVNITEFKGTRLFVEYKMTNHSTNELVCTANSTHCFTFDGRVVNLKKKFPEIYKNFKVE